MKKFTALFIAILSILSFSVLAEDFKTNETGLDKRNFDTQVSPCNDFYQHANGSWVKRNPVPAAYSKWSVFNEVIERNNIILKDIAESAAQNNKAKAGSNLQKIGDFYAAAMAVDQIETTDTKPLTPYFQEIAAIKSNEDLQNVIGKFHKLGLDSVFNVEIDVDLKNSSKTIAYVKQGGLGLPDRDYYTKTDSESQTIRTQYQAHLVTMFKLLGNSDAQAQQKAKQAFHIETQLAKSSLTNVEKRDPNAEYKMVSVADANTVTPHFNWENYFKTLGVSAKNQFSFATDTFFKNLDSLLANESLASWQAYLEWHLIDDTAPYLSDKFEQAHFNFYGKTLSGTKTMRPRWKRSLSAINTHLGEAMGQLFVEKQFPPEAKKSAIEMIKNIEAALHDRINNLSWMEEDTKKQAQKKLSTFMIKIGYPDKWIDYSDLAISRNSYIENVLNAKAFTSQLALDEIGKPVNRKKWFMNPQDVNAYYNPLFNEIVFPAGILQPPFFDFKNDAAVNYGAMGGVIGHEISHGFDDQGSQFDADGNLKNWWTEKDLQEFKNRTAILIQQYSAFQPLPGVHVNGELTIGENIGDFSGMTLAQAGLQKALAGKTDPMIDGQTQEQRFFFSWAQAWRNTITPQEMKLRVNTDPHSPGKYRVNGAVANIPEFQDAFSCQVGDPMIQPDNKKVVLW